MTLRLTTSLNANKWTSMYLIFDTETTGLPDYKLPLDDPNQARIVQLACLLLDKSFNEVGCFHSLIQPTGWSIHPGAQAAHGITIEECQESGIPVEAALHVFEGFYGAADVVIAHNLKFDARLVMTEQTLLSCIASVELAGEIGRAHV